MKSSAPTQGTLPLQREGDTAATPDPEHFRFRRLHPLLRLGTASDRYAGWLGQIYSSQRFEHRIAKRQKVIGGKKFIEGVLPVECVEEYFQHFSILELDFTFYRPLLASDGRPTPNFHALHSYRTHLGDRDRIFLKAPQAVCARNLQRGKAFLPNPDYLDSDLFIDRFYDPAVQILGHHLGGIIFEQEYQKKAQRQPPAQVAEEWGQFFAALPKDSRYHLELRTEAYLRPELVSMLASHGVGQVLSHWTWLPSLQRQFHLGGEQFTNAGGDVVIRLLTPREVRYEDAYARAHPFAHLVPGMLDPQMIADTVRLAGIAIDHRVQTNTIVNNRAGGNAPEIARQIAVSFLGGTPCPQ